MIHTEAIVAENSLIKIKSILVPDLEEGQLEINNVCSLISPGTELHYAKKTLSDYVGVLPLGYCSSGYVNRVGAGVSGFQVGDRVIAMGLNYAIHARRICVPYMLCVKIEGEVSFEEAVFANLLATPVHAVNRAPIKKDEKVMIVGAGLLGQLLAQYALNFTKNVYITDLSQPRLEIAQKSGVTAIYPQTGKWLQPLCEQVNNSGVDKVFLCITGDGTETIKDSISALSKAPDGIKTGTVVCIGRFDASISFNVDMGNADIINSARCGLGYKDSDYEHGKKSYQLNTGQQTVNDNLKTSLKFIESDRIMLKYIHTHRVNFEDACEMYNILKGRNNAVGVTVHYDTVQ